MNDSKVRSFTGACGLAAGALLLVVTPLYLVTGTPPSLGNEAVFSAYVTTSAGWYAYINDVMGLAYIG